MTQGMVSRGMNQIQIVGARTHNLQNISVTMPRQAWTVITGVSGSGKSSLAFHTLFAEGQRRFLGTLSGRSREWLDQLPRPEVDSIQGLPPVIAVEQFRTNSRSRSTVATLTEILDYLRVLYARLGRVYCPDCHCPVQAQSPEQIIQKIQQFPDGTKLMLMAPLVHEVVGEHEQIFRQIARDGFVRARVDGEIIDVNEPPKLAAQKPHTIEVVIDRLILKPEIQQRLADSVEHALRLGEGSCLVVIQEQGEWQDHLFHRDLCCPECGANFMPLEPRTFSWNSPQGACLTCEGTGLAQVPTPDSEESETASSGDDEAVEGAEEQQILSEEAAVCAACTGTRLNPVAAHVKVQGKTLPELLSLSLRESLEWIQELPDQSTSATDELLAHKLIEPLISRFRFLEAVGVGYLSLNRRAETLSGGELQRVRLARCLGTQLQGSCYILDEPTAGLHTADTARLIAILRQMTQQGNTVICVEHDLNVIQAADYLLEFGPGGGQAGGQLLFAGTPHELIAGGVETPTSLALASAQKILSTHEEGSAESQHKWSPDQKQCANPAPLIHLQESHLHNLKNVTIQLPMEQLTCVMGVSGSGKSSLILDALAPLIRQALQANQLEWSEETRGKFSADAPIQRLLIVDQSFAGKSSRSCPATFSGIWQEIRQILAQTKLSRLRGYTARRFSFNSTAGTCPECTGRGEVKVALTMLAETHVPCSTCRGQRFNPQTLAIRYHNKNAAELLEMTIDEACDFWKDVSPVQKKLQAYQDIGLGYLCLGQPARTLSGGEVQRMKLAREMSQQLTLGVLILDEPTRGLHWSDVGRLLQMLKKIVTQNNTVIVVEHHPLVRHAADWHIQLGPGAGVDGGEILFAGPAIKADSISL